MLRIVSRKWLLSILTTIFALFVSSIVLALVANPLSMQIVRKRIIDEFMNDPTNLTYWGDIPGYLTPEATQKYTFFNFTNSWALLGEDSTYLLPRFEVNNSLEFVESKAILNFNANESDYEFDVVRTLNHSSNSSVVNNITIPNIYSIGLWNDFKYRNSSRRAFRGIGGLLYQMTAGDSFYYDILGITLEAKYFYQKSTEWIYSVYFQPLGISIEESRSIIEDKINGLKDWQSMRNWLIAGRQYPSNGSMNYLQSYFGSGSLRNQSIELAVVKVVLPLLNSVDNEMKIKYNCVSVPCTSLELAWLQIGTGGVTDALPSSYSAPSINFINSTYFGFLEFPVFYDYHFKYVIDKNPEYAKYSTLTLEQSSSLFEIPASLFCCTKSWRTLAHPGNLADLLSMAAPYIASKNISLLQQITQRFGLQNNMQSRIVVEYVRYIADKYEEVWQAPYEQLARIELFTIGAERVYLRALKKLKVFLQRQVSTPKFLNMDCYVVLTISKISPEKAKNFCQKGWTKEIIKSIFNFYNSQSDIVFDETLKRFGLDFNDALNICYYIEEGSRSTAVVIKETEALISKQYDCRNPNWCTSEELVSIQWVNSTVSKKPPHGQDMLEPCSSIYYWGLVDKPFEFDAFDPISLDKPDKIQALELLTGSKMFSLERLADAVVKAENGYPARLKEVYQQKDPREFDRYINKFIIENVLGGLIIQEKESLILSGYTDPTIEFFRQLNPLRGGDPSLSTFSLIKYTRSSREVWSAKPIFSLKKLNGTSSIMLTKKYFTGNETIDVSYQQNCLQCKSWSGNEFLYPIGESGFTQKNIYFNEIPRNLQANYKRRVRGKMNIMSNRYELSLTDSPSYNSCNQTWNMTEALWSPILISKAYLESASCPFEKSLAGNIEIVNATSLEKIKFDIDKDPFFVNVEPITGIPSKSNYVLQYNILIEKDHLFWRNNSVVLPLITVRRETQEMNETATEYNFKIILLAEEIEDTIITVLVICASVLFIMWMTLYLNNKDVLKRSENELYQKNITELINEHESGKTLKEYKL